MSSASAFVILADEAAGWRIAGLAQLDRIVLALNELVETGGGNETIEAVIYWHPDVPPANRWLPRHPRITRVRLTESTKSVPAGARLLHARLFVEREGLGKFLTTVRPVSIDAAIEESPNGWSELSRGFINSLPPGNRQSPWWFVQSPRQSAHCEKRLLRRSGKSQDGIVSRFLNRPLSRRLSRFLLRYDVTPTRWTIGAFMLPLVAFFCFARGDYFGIVAGAILFQFYSIVDGCDGEIARATYQESEWGGRIDDFFDLLGSLFFVIGLGLGLFRSRSSIYLLEGVVCAIVIGVNEWGLRRVKTDEQPESPRLTASLYPRHRRLLATGGFASWNENLVWWLVQFTKRDVAIFAFVILALLDQSQWILHLWLMVSAGTLLLSARSGPRQRSTIQPRP